MTQPSFPPLFLGQEVTGKLNPFAKACAQAMLGCDAGLVAHNLSADTLRAAIVFAPEVALEEAMAMLPTCGIGFQNALGALGPPEVAVHLEWAGGLRINGATCGKLRVAASSSDTTTVPNCMVIGLELPLWPENDAPGDTPDQTTLYVEGCADVNAMELLESWVKHTLVGINTWAEDGVKSLHKDWRGLSHGIGEDLTINKTFGTFLGIDEQFGMLIRAHKTTHIIPLTFLLEGT